jgi:hypothetical protein
MLKNNFSHSSRLTTSETVQHKFHVLDKKIQQQQNATSLIKIGKFV